MSDNEPGLNQQREEGPVLKESDIQAKINLWSQNQPKRETISLDKSNAITNSPIDNQIRNGVDFFDDETSSHTGFVPKTDLVSRYHQMRDAIIAPTWNTGAARTNTKTRNAYGANDEYVEALGVGLSVPSHILEGDNIGPAKENYPMSNWASLLPIERQSMYAKVDNNTYQFHRQGTIPPGVVDGEVYPAFDVSTQMTLYGVPKLGGGVSSFGDSEYATSALTTPFMTTPLVDFISPNFTFTEDSPLNPASYTVQSITSTAVVSPTLGSNADYIGTSNVGPFGFNDTALTYPSADGSVNGSLVQLWNSTKAITFDYGGIVVEPDFEGIAPLDAFLKAPSGLNSSNLFGQNDVRTISNSGPFKGDSLHPIVVRNYGGHKGEETSMNWSDVGIGSAPTEISDPFGLISDLYLNMGGATHERYKRWAESTAGAVWLDLQKTLQSLNPTLETTGFQSKSVLLSPFGEGGTVGYRHIARHIDAENNRYQKMLKSEKFPTFITDNFTFTSTEPSNLQSSMEYGFGSRIAMQSRYDISPEASFTLTFGNMVFNTSIGVEEAPMSQLIYFSNPNRYNRQLSSAPVTISDGIPSFTVNPGSGEGSTAESDASKILNTQGGTFKSDTHFRDKVVSNISQKYATLAYGRLNNNFSYETQLESPAEVTGLLDEGDSGAVGVFPDASLKGEAFGLKFEVGVGNNPRRLKQSQRRKDKKTNDDIGTVKNNTKLLDTSLEETVDPVLGVIRRSVTDTGGIASGVSDAVDKINYSRYGAEVDGENVFYVEDGANTTKDFIKFRFYDVINGKYIIFRAILSGISDSITTDYNEDKYIGRPDKLYTYRGADRSVSFNFKVYPKTKQELPMLMEKMNYLVGLCYPSLGALGRMKSPFVQLTLGDMIEAQPGILRNVTVTVDENSTWEIQQGLQFPKHINVAIQFTYIGNHLPVGTSNSWYGGLKPDQIEPKSFVDILKSYVNYDFGSTGNTLVDSALELIGDNKKLKEARNSFNKHANQLGFKI